VVVYVNHSGATSRTCSIRLVLGSICWQLASIYGLDTDLIPDDYPGLVAYFNGLLQVCSPPPPRFYVSAIVMPGFHSKQITWTL